MGVELSVETPQVQFELPVVKEEQSEQSDQSEKTKSELNEHEDIHSNVVLPVQHRE